MGGKCFSPNNVIKALEAYSQIQGWNSSIEEKNFSKQLPKDEMQAVVVIADVTS